MSAATDAAHLVNGMRSLRHRAAGPPGPTPDTPDRGPSPCQSTPAHGTPPEQQIQQHKHQYNGTNAPRHDAEPADTPQATGTGCPRTQSPPSCKDTQMSFRKYRTRPATIQALEVNLTTLDIIRKVPGCNIVASPMGDGVRVHIDTPGGTETAHPGDYITLDDLGNPRVVPAQEFNQTYEPDAQ